MGTLRWQYQRILCDVRFEHVTVHALFPGNNTENNAFPLTKFKYSCFTLHLDTAGPKSYQLLSPSISRNPASV